MGGSFIHSHGTKVFIRHRPDDVQDVVAQARFNEKKWVWVKDSQRAYAPAQIVTEMENEVEVELETGLTQLVPLSEVYPMNPPKFDMVDDMAELTHLNEPSVIHNLTVRHRANHIYTYSGLFLVAVNPYRTLPIYSDEYVQAYKGRRRGEMPPHIYAVVDQAFHDMLHDKENQSILITGESGAGKTENTKIAIKYLASVASKSPIQSMSSCELLERQILQANPILESFGNAQTIRNNNSSRFGKFIRIEFNLHAQICGANIEWYLLEKSRVHKQTEQERNYHIFYQLMNADETMKEQLLLSDGKPSDYVFTQGSNPTIEGVDDAEEYRNLMHAMDVMGMSDKEKLDYFRIVAAVLHLGNITLYSDYQGDRADIRDFAPVERVCHLLGIPPQEFKKSLLTPRIKAGQDWVNQTKTALQVKDSLRALAKVLYERNFGSLVDRINRAIDGQKPSEKLGFIGVLDIAGFEIFKPMGILSCLEEECVAPRGTDKRFLEKLNKVWATDEPGTKYVTTRFKDAFVVRHYAGDVEYSAENWIEKNKDPLNEDVTRLLARSTQPHVATLFEDYLTESRMEPTRSFLKLRKGGGFFRTVGQRHKEQLTLLMKTLYHTHPHFIRCILPNDRKRAGEIQPNLVLHQLRCNGVLEGIRICRKGYPNRLSFAEFRKRYEILCPNKLAPNRFIDGRSACQTLIDAMELEPEKYRIGTTKVFFKATVLAELEEIRDHKLSNYITGFQAMCRSYVARHRMTKCARRTEAIKVLQRNARIYVTLREWPWWKIYAKLKPLNVAYRVETQMKEKDQKIFDLEQQIKAYEEQLVRLETRNSELELQQLEYKELLETEHANTRELEEAKKNLLDNLLSADERAEELTQVLEESRGQVEEKDQFIEELTREVGLRGAEKESLSAECAKLREQNQQLIDQIVQLESKQRSSSADQAALHAKIFSMIYKAEDLAKDLRDCIATQAD
ncbi:hypothetical protein EC973_007318 [Apophysomyces ossiformis]|uniref:Myosin motor domain-containing protein n=1 Tax=Apophysomyces ossiformis TaxID=679940 RepID=A0A8H7EPX5_9FUNG|nr:hypothetical protein EC973_007318 [Apophysomyces ossiformis]